MAKQAFKNQDQAFSSRFIPNSLQAHNHYKFSVAWLPVSPQWRTLRRILNTNFFSSNKLDANQHLSQQGEALDIGQVAFKTNLNLLSNTLFSKDLADPFSDSKVELKDVIWGIMADVGKPNLVDFFPILGKIDLQGIRCRAIIHIGKLFKLFDGLINERLEEKRKGFCEKSDVLEMFLNITEKDPEKMNHNHISPCSWFVFSSNSSCPSILHLVNAFTT
ncbi:hypothetical protein KY290_037923 [Solanum tuberosum]|uniref:Cytochrome P450 n=2 Tax=Solanum tuberosum TaxID=4113 RepID=A0ABQ7TYT1_SOLTU|nr:PREDICTED: geraniol 8-hydroxylase-like [Solanum tuberosum]KAH0640688.1 hypothetical protein KY285_037274 [Solanum tuberosum]KAH0704130.1 hypothetical protein KY285_018408 [Solanum tuberosum]KAH0739218.1 hypothetical protein KY290_037923 [Solanum tuberosum]